MVVSNRPSLKSLFFTVLSKKQWYLSLYYHSVQYSRLICPCMLDIIHVHEYESNELARLVGLRCLLSFHLVKINQNLLRFLFRH